MIIHQLKVELWKKDKKLRERERERGRERERIITFLEENVRENSKINIILNTKLSKPCYVNRIILYSYIQSL